MKIPRTLAVFKVLDDLRRPSSCCYAKQASTNARQGSKPGGMKRRNSMLLPRRTGPQPESNNLCPTTSGSGWRDYSLYYSWVGAELLKNAST